MKDLTRSEQITITLLAAVLCYFTARTLVSLIFNI